MQDRSLKALNRRRVLNLGTLSAASLVALGLTRLPRHTAMGRDGGPLLSGDATPTVLAFMGALFGRVLSARDAADLSDRLNYGFARSKAFTEDCGVLARFLDKSARERGAPSFESCDAAQKDSIVGDLMRIDARSAIARLLSRSAPSERAYYRMRSSTVGRLAWIYRHSSAAWRARGYRRWPGVAGNWHEVLEPGAPYP